MKHLLFLVMVVTFSHPLIAQMKNCKMPDAADKKFITTKVEVKGLVGKPFTITPENIKKLNLNVYEQKNVKVVCQTDGNVKKNLANFRGLLLRDIIVAADAKLEKAIKKDRGAYYILVTASDGYKVIFTYNELMVTAGGNNTFLLFEENGKPIVDDGKFVVMCTSDLVTGARHVKWVKSIEVKKA